MLKPLFRLQHVLCTASSTLYSSVFSPTTCTRGLAHAYLSTEEERQGTIWSILWLYPFGVSTASSPCYSTTLTAPKAGILSRDEAINGRGQRPPWLIAKIPCLQRKYGSLYNAWLKKRIVIVPASNWWNALRLEDSLMEICEDSSRRTSLL